jgi:GxxExxY protein
LIDPRACPHPRQNPRQELCSESHKGLQDHCTIELQKRGLRVERQVPVPIFYDDIRFDEGFRADLIVNGKVILELKSIERVTNVHKKQLLTYLRLSGLKVGYLLNFGEALMKDGITRSINGQIT